MQKLLHKFLLIAAVALLFRLPLIFTVYHGDLNNNISWGNLAVERGLMNFYEGEDWSYSAPNQPPLTILLFAATSYIWQFMDATFWWLNQNYEIFYSPLIWFWESRGMMLLVKLPSILADLGIAYIIYSYMKRKKKETLGLKLSAVWLFNPVTWYNSSIWGQTDAIVNFLGLAAVFFLLRKNLLIFTVFFTLSLLFKGSLAIFVPILIFIVLWQKHRVGEWIKAAAASLGVVVLASIWFHPSLDLVPWLVTLYKERILPGEIGFLTANAFNFWWLVDPGRTLDSAVYLGLPARVWGFTAALGGISGIIWWLKRKASDARIFYALALTALLTFLFMTRIHERYLYPFFPYSTLLLGLLPSTWGPYLVLSGLHLLNLYHLFWAPSFALLEVLYTISWFTQALSLVNIAIFFWVLRLGIKHL